MKSIFDQWYDDNYQKKLKHHDSYWKCKQSWLAAQKQQLDETNALRAKVAELEAKLAKYENLEPVAWLHTFEKQNGDRETDASISFAVAKAFCDFGDPIPLYALEK